MSFLGGVLRSAGIEQAPADEMLQKPYVDEHRMNSQVVDYLRRMFRASDQLPLALEKIVVPSDARAIDQGRLWCNGLIGDAIDEFGK